MERWAIGCKMDSAWDPDPVEHAVPWDAPAECAESLCGRRNLTVVEEWDGSRIPFEEGCWHCEQILASKTGDGRLRSP